jgi:hypothetical protein
MRLPHQSQRSPAGGFLANLVAGFGPEFLPCGFAILETFINWPKSKPQVPLELTTEYIFSIDIQ